MLRYLEFCLYAIKILSMMSHFLNLAMLCVIHSSEFTRQWRPLAWKVITYHLVVYSASFFFQKTFISFGVLIYLSNVYTHMHMCIHKPIYKWAWLSQWTLASEQPTICWISFIWKCCLLYSIYCQLVVERYYLLIIALTRFSHNSWPSSWS